MSDSQNRVPVLAPDGEVLTPCRPARARQMIDEGRATPFWNQGVFCIRLREEPSSRETPYTVCGIDPGSKAEGFTVKSTKDTYLNIQAEARTGVSKKLKKRKEYRRGRRKSCPHRPSGHHKNRKHNGKIPPSTKARWDWKLSICEWLSEMYPIDKFVVEDPTEPKNMEYNPLLRGKEYFYNNLSELSAGRVGSPSKMASWRDCIDLHKSFSNKTEVDFLKHCVDSWMLAWLETNCPFSADPEFEKVLSIAPLDSKRRVFPFKEMPSSCKTEYPLKRGSLVKHDDHGLVYIGDHPDHPPYGALRSFKDGSIVSRRIDPVKCEYLCALGWHLTGN
jgi:hypothetical protein